jgi:serine/threonine protein kinase
MSALGNGGMGTVWLAEDDLLSRRVAVKEVSPPADMTEQERELLRERTLREARTAARLSHPNVVTIYDVVEDDGRPWIVMELIPSRSLRDVVDAEGPLTAQQAAAAGLQVLAALRAAHALGIMHRDVKPGNVLIDEGGRAVLADFGIARTQDSPALTTSGMVVGSPSYIAPERARGEQGGPESDLWSLGATLYALVEGRPAYDRAGALPTLMAVVNEDPDPPSRAGELWPVIRGLLDHVPSRRLGPDEAERMLRQVAGSSDGSGTVPLPRLAQETDPGGDPGRTREGSSLGSSEDTRTLRPWDAALPGEPDPGALAEQPDPGALQEQPDPGALAEEPDPGALQEQPDPDALQEQPDPGTLPGEPGAGAYPGGPGSGAFPGDPGPRVFPDTPPGAEPGEAAPGRPVPHRKQLTLVLAATVVLALAAGVVVAMILTSHHTALATPNPGGSTGRPASSPSAGPSAGSSAPPTARPSSPAPASRPGPLGPAVIPAGYHEFRNSTGFSIAVPDGWRVSHQGHYVYLVPPSGAEFLLIDQSDHPQPNPLADWQQQEANRESTYPGYHRIRLQSVRYPQSEKAADWEFTYYHQGVLTHVLNRNVLANARHAYALYWSTPQSQWSQSWRIFKVLAETFRPAAP